MAVQELQDNESLEQPGGDVLVSRQPVVDGDMRVRGYRVAYASLEDWEPPVAGDGRPAQLFGDLMCAVGLEDLVGSSIAHLVVSTELLLTIGIPPISPDRVILRVAEETAADPRVWPTLRSLASSGFSLALYGVVDPTIDGELLEVFSTVEVDFLVWDELDATAAVPRLAAAQVTALASGLLNHSDFAMAKALGFQLFTGPFFAAPRVSSGRQVPVGSFSALQSLAQFHAEAPIERLEAAIDRDLGLSVKLLRYINSAYFGLRSNITSIRQAVMMLGSAKVSQWALLIALTGGPTAPAELSMMALTRARMCQLLGASAGRGSGDTLFTVGLLSVADALLDLPLETVIAQLPLAEEVAEALLWQAGPSGEILATAIAYERGEFGAVRGPHRKASTRAYRESLRWARETVASLS